MTLIPEQLSAASKSPFEAQLDFVRALTTQAFKSAEQVVTLNLNTSRVSVERSSTAVRQLLSATDPRDLLLLTSHTQQQFQTLVNYSRALFNIAASARLDLPYQRAAEVSAPPAQPQAAAQPEAAAQAEAQADAATAPGWPSRAAQAAPAAPETSATAEPAAPAQPAVQAAFSPATPEPEPSAAGVAAANVVETLVEAAQQNLAAAMPEALPQAIAQATPLAQAISQVTAQSPVAEHPLASPLPDTAAHEIEIASIRPVEATAPASRAAAIEGKRTGTTGAKGTRRK
jgi:phasin family protein